MKTLLIACMIFATALVSGTDIQVEFTDGTVESAPIEMINQITFQEYQSTTVQGIELQWRTSDEYLYVNVIAPTTGWVAVGFNPTNQMADANIIIGYVDDDGEVYIRDDFGTSSGSHAADEGLGGTDDVDDEFGKEENGMTTIHFKIPLDSGDQYDQALTLGMQYPVILAYGSADNFTAIHSVATGTSIQL